MEYALIVLLVVFTFWVAIKKTNVGSQLANAWIIVGPALRTRQVVINLIPEGAALQRDDLPERVYSYWSASRSLAPWFCTGFGFGPLHYFLHPR